MAESLWADTDASWIEFGWVEGYHATLDTQWVECGWAWVGWIEGDEVCLIPTDEPSTPRPIGGGGTGFERSRSRISVAPQGSRSYKDYGRKDPRRQEEEEIIEFVVKFVTEYL